MNTPGPTWYDPAPMAREDVPQPQTRFRVRWGEVATCVGVLAAFTVAGMAFVGAVTERQAERMPERPAVSTLAPCTTEDDPGPCYWDATRHGNGAGRSFVVMEDHVFYLPESE